VASTIDAHDAAEFRKLGVHVPENRIVEASDAIEVWDVNWPIMADFLALQTQWRAAATLAGLIWLGLDYAAAAARLGGKRFRRHAADLAAMESEALDVLNEGDEA